MRIGSDNPCTVGSNQTYLSTTTLTQRQTSNKNERTLPYYVCIQRSLIVKLFRARAEFR